MLDGPTPYRTSVVYAPRMTTDLYCRAEFDSLQTTRAHHTNPLFIPSETGVSAGLTICCAIVAVSATK